MVNDLDFLQELEVEEEEDLDEETLEGEDNSDEPDPVDVLKQTFENQIADLRRSVGRVQSLAAKFENGNQSESTDNELREQFEQTSEQLDILINGLDDGLVDPDTKDKLIEARQRARAAAERSSLRKEILEELRPAQAPQPDIRELAVQAEQALVSEIESYGLDPEDEVFDWKQAGTLFQQGDYAGMQRYIRERIREGLTAANSESRRQVRKESSKETPRATQESQSQIESIFEDGEIKDLDEAVLELEKLGITV